MTSSRLLDLTGRPGLPAELERWVATLRLVPPEATPHLRLERDGDRFRLERPRLPGRPLAGLRLPAAEALPLARALLAALAAFHDRGIPHGNLKPENILLADGGGVTLLDPLPPFHHDLLGIDDEDLRRKLAYGPPEAAIGRRVGPPGDLYRLGVILHLAVAGENPFRHIDPVMEGRHHLTRPAPPLAETVEGCPPLLSALVARLTATDPAHRFPDARSCLLALDAGAIPPPPPAPAIFTPPEPAPPEVGEEMRRILLALGFAFILGAAILARAWFRG